jgi:hypothetical protein
MFPLFFIFILNKFIIMGYPEKQYSRQETAKEYTKVYTLDLSDEIVLKQEDGMLGYISVSDLASYINLRTAEKLGWARYDDTQYTTSSVFSLTTAAGEQILPNNGGNTMETHLHSSVSFYDSGSQKIQVENVGDTYMCTVVFDAKTANANAAHLRIQLDNTVGTPYERVGKDLFFGKGNDVWHEYHEVFQWYGDEDFVTNGNRWRVQAFGATVSIANIIFFIQRTQNHTT